ncbi:uncharacterized protein LOC122364510 isoform X2 [Amphibalanus amphitrite]|uniref:uncharacterized protein LOC122364510 isoform X2 n=1 Tax=Amphibalanus amphitrite TaxID=1232801 RepID=UPI001C9183A0|nr:uncharacterized protein LOC122364510 isoform X2 [Amphibalanus amphitrite]
MMNQIAGYRRGSSATPTTAQHDGLQTPNGTLGSAAATSRAGFIWTASATPHTRRCSCPRCRPRIFRNAKLEDMKLLPNLKDVVRWRLSARVPLPTRPQERPHEGLLCVRCLLAGGMEIERTWSGGGCRPESLSRHGRTKGRRAFQGCGVGVGVGRSRQFCPESESELVFESRSRSRSRRKSIDSAALVHSMLLAGAMEIERTWSGGDCRPESLSRHGSTKSRQRLIISVKWTDSLLQDVVRWRLSARVPLPTRPQERPHEGPSCIRCCWQAPWKLKGRGPVAAVGPSPSPDTALGSAARRAVVHWMLLAGAMEIERTWSGGGCRPESLSRHGFTEVPSFYEAGAFIAVTFTWLRGGRLVGSP